MRPDVTISYIHSYLTNFIKAEKDENNKICLITLIILLVHTKVDEILSYINAAEAAISSMEK